jgi:cytochrome c-type biogenesis protein CcmH/NrfG
MGKQKESGSAQMVQKQTLYIAILISITLGFMLGALYTSHKLAGEGGAVQSVPAAAGGKPGSQDTTDARVGEQILKLEEFLKANPNNAEAWTQLGNIFFDTNRFKDAIEAYEKSVELEPGNANVLTDLGVMHRRNKSPEKAVKYFDLAIQAAPDHETARFNKGIVLMHDLNDLPGAIATWEGLLEVNPMATAPNGQLVNTLVQGLKEQQQ